MPFAPMSPSPRMRPPVETQMKRTSRSGQLRSTSAMRPFMWRVMYIPRGAPVDVAEGQARLRDRRVVEDRHEAHRIGHHRAVEQRLVPVQQADQIDVPLKVGRLGFQVPHHPFNLPVQALRRRRKQTLEAVLRSVRLR